MGQQTGGQFIILLIARAAGDHEVPHVAPPWHGTRPERHDPHIGTVGQDMQMMTRQRPVPHDLAQSQDHVLRQEHKVHRRPPAQQPALEPA